MRLDQKPSKKELFSKCSVCQGPAASHSHYGAVTCYSCRAFFRRGIGKSYCCVEGSGGCLIDFTSRRSCQWCRFDRCLRVGMQPELVDAAIKKKVHKERASLPTLIENLQTLEGSDVVTEVLKDISDSLQILNKDKDHEGMCRNKSSLDVIKSSPLPMTSDQVEFLSKPLDDLFELHLSTDSDVDMGNSPGFNEEYAELFDINSMIPVMSPDNPSFFCDDDKKLREKDQSCYPAFPITDSIQDFSNEPLDFQHFINISYTPEEQTENGRESASEEYCSGYFHQESNKSISKCEQTEFQTGECKHTKSDSKTHFTKSTKEEDIVTNDGDFMFNKISDFCHAQGISGFTELEKPDIVNLDLLIDEVFTFL